MLVLILVYKKIDILFLTTKEIQHLRKRIEPCAWQCQLALTEREYPASHFKITQARLFNFSNPIKALLPCHPKTHCNGKNIYLLPWESRAWNLHLTSLHPMREEMIQAQQTAEQMKSYGGATTALLPARHERVRWSSCLYAELRKFLRNSLF